MRPCQQGDAWAALVNVRRTAHGPARARLASSAHERTRRSEASWTRAKSTASSACTYAFAGCADPSARNYAADATVHVASACTYAVRGCMLPTARNYVALATLDDGSCALHSPPPLPMSPPLPIAPPPSESAS